MTCLRLMGSDLPRFWLSELLEALRGQNKKVRVIVTTGYSTIASGSEAITKGAQDFISKPFEFADGTSLGWESRLWLAHLQAGYSFEVLFVVRVHRSRIATEMLSNGEQVVRQD